MKNETNETQTRQIPSAVYNSTDMSERRVANLSTDISTESKSGELASVDAILIKMANVDLNRSVILGGDQPVSRRAASTHAPHKFS